MIKVRTNWKQLVRDLCHHHNQWGFCILNLEGEEMINPPDLPNLTEDLLEFDGRELNAKEVRAELWRKYRKGEYSFIYSMYDKDINKSLIGMGHHGENPV